MNRFPPTIIFRHRKENKKKCSVQPLCGKEGFIFCSYPEPSFPPLENYVVLSLEGEELSKEDSSKGILLIDATWRYAKKMHTCLEQKSPHLQMRTLPKHYTTAYPRYQTDCEEPARGLASIEALFIAYYLMGRDTSSLLDDYYWKDTFLKMNDFPPL